MERLVKAHLDHRRAWLDFDYCYPVISRRSRGVSLGVDLNPDKVCNFDCVYCEVDHLTPPRRRDVDVEQVVEEMATLLTLVETGALFETGHFTSARPDQRRLNDIALSGNGEPTTAQAFADVVERLADLKAARGLTDVKLILITNATRLQHPDVVRGIDRLMSAQGEIWAKLDMGLETAYKAINRSRVPFGRILENLRFASQRWPLLIQTLLLSWRGQGPTDIEVDAYVQTLRELAGHGSHLQGVQLYTVARPTPEPEARPLAAAELDRIGAQVKDALPHLAVDIFYGPEA